MKRIFGAALLGLVIVAAGGAQADDAPGGKGKGKGKGKGLFRRDPEVLFQKMDANSDGKVTREEFKSFLENAGEGNLKDRPKRVERIFDKLDANGDGSLSLEEFKKLPELRGQHKGKAAKKGKTPNDNP